MKKKNLVDSFISILSIAIVVDFVLSKIWKRGVLFLLKKLYLKFFS